MEAKRQRTTNRSQFTTMVENMKKHPDIATNMTKKSPDAVLQFWDSLATELNNLGPPCKSVAEWKKVWSDYKSGIKKKLTHNKREQKRNGGGQNTQMYLSSLEEVVVAITSMHTIVDGIPKVGSFGVPARVRNDDVPSTSRAVDSMNVDVEVEQANDEVEGPGDDASHQEKRNREPKQIRLLEKRIKINEEHLQKYVKLTEETNGSLKKISRNLEKLHEDAKTSHELFRGFITDMRNHFAFMQKVACEKNACCSNENSSSNPRVADSETSQQEANKTKNQDDDEEMPFYKQELMSSEDESDVQRVEQNEDEKNFKKSQNSEPFNRVAEEEQLTNLPEYTDPPDHNTHDNNLIPTQYSGQKSQITDEGEDISNFNQEFSSEDEEHNINVQKMRMLELQIKQMNEEHELKMEKLKLEIGNLKKREFFNTFLS